MTYILAISILANVFFAYYCIKFAIIVIRVQDSIEDSLDKIDKKYNRLTQISKIPVFFDSPEIKSIIYEITEVQNIVLEIASTLSNSVNKKENVIEEEEINQ